MDSTIHVVIRLADGNVAIVYRDRRVVVVDRDGLVTRDDIARLTDAELPDVPPSPESLH
jgi:hypothetical protein